MRNKTRAQKIEEVCRYFAAEMSEDPIDGTAFDCDVLDALDAVKKKYKDLPED